MFVKVKILIERLSDEKQQALPAISQKNICAAQRSGVALIKG